MKKSKLPIPTNMPVRDQPSLVKFWEISAHFRTECELRKAKGRRVTPDLPLRLAEAAYSHGLDYSRFCSATGLSINAAKSATRRLGIDLETPTEQRPAAILTTEQPSAITIEKELVMNTKKTRTPRSKIQEDVSVAVEMLAANGNLPSPDEVRRLTGYSKATVNRYYPSPSESSPHREDAPPVVGVTENMGDGSTEFVVRIGWPEGRSLPQKFSLVFG